MHKFMLFYIKYLAEDRSAEITAFRRFPLLCRVSGSWMKLFWTIPPYQTSPVQSSLMASKHGQTASNRPTDFQWYSHLGTWMAIPALYLILCTNPWAVFEQRLRLCLVDLSSRQRDFNFVTDSWILFSRICWCWVEVSQHWDTVRPRRWNHHQILPRVLMSILWIVALSRCRARCPQMRLFKRLWKCFIRITVPYSFFLCVVKRHTVTPSAVRWL